MPGAEHAAIIGTGRQIALNRLADGRVLGRQPVRGDQALAQRALSAVVEEQIV
jgi:hypothetical protein